MKNTTSYLCLSAMIAALYTALSLIFAPISYGPIQCRVSELLTILPAFLPAAIPGVTLGCLISNILGGCVLPDIIFGTLATFIGAVFTRILTQKCVAGCTDSKMSLRFRLSASLPPIISNTIIIPLVLRYAYGIPDAVWFLALTVGIGEIISCGIFGQLVISAMNSAGVRGVIAKYKLA